MNMKAKLWTKVESIAHLDVEAASWRQVWPSISHDFPKEKACWCWWFFACPAPGLSHTHSHTRSTSLTVPRYDHSLSLYQSKILMRDRVESRRTRCMYYKYLQRRGLPTGQQKIVKSRGLMQIHPFAILLAQSCMLAEGCICKYTP